MMYILRVAFAILAFCSALALARIPQLSPTIEQLVEQYNLHVDSESITVSGLSSGAFFAVQFHVAYSAIVHGAAVFAGGPYLCSKGTLAYATTTCMAPLTQYQAPKAYDYKLLAESAASKGLIDPLINLGDDPVFFYSGTVDSVVYPVVVNAAEDFYKYFTAPSKVAHEFAIKAEHAQPTLSYGNPCTELSSPYINKCNYDGAYNALSHLYGSLQPAGTAQDSNLIKFDQTPYFSGSLTSIDRYGYIYIPTACRNGSTCKLHVSFHGCLQDVADIGTQYAHDAGYNRWAESNNIIVLYPYVTASTMLGNPNACWDWWAYTNKEFAYKNGVQMKFVRDIIQALLNGTFA